MDTFVRYLQNHDFDLSLTKAARLEEDEDEDEVQTATGDGIEEDEVIYPETFEELRRSDFIAYIANEAYNYMYSSDGPYRTSQKNASVQRGYKDAETGEYTTYVDLKEEDNTFNSENEESCRETAIITVRQLCDMSIKLCCNLMDVFILKAKRDAFNLKVNHEYFAKQVRRWRPASATSPGAWFPYIEKSGYRNAPGFREGFGYIKGEDTLPTEVLDMFAHLEMICATMNIDMSLEDPTPYTKEGLPITVRTAMPKNLEYCAEVLNAYSNMSLGSHTEEIRSPLENATRTLAVIGPRTVITDTPYIIEECPEMSLDTACEFVSRILNANIDPANCQYIGGVLTMYDNPIMVNGSKLGINATCDYFISSSGILVPYFDKVVPKTFKVGDIQLMLAHMRLNYGLHPALWYVVE